MKLSLAVLVAVAVLLSTPPAGADPFNPPCTITPEQSCAHSGTRSGEVRYCPDTGGFVGVFTGSCPSLWMGPYAPGNPSYGDDDDR
jgi:hypothetical protein